MHASIEKIEYMKVLWKVHPNDSLLSSTKVKQNRITQTIRLGLSVTTYQAVIISISMY